MSLNITKLRYKNFLSTGNDFTEFDFTEHSTTLVIGKNGSGKSTFIDALIFGLYGKAYRKINKPQLINTINNKDLMVEVEFKSNNRDYLIRRGIKPNIFEVYQNGNLLNQDAKIKDYQSSLEENILKIGYRAFTQIVVLGSAQHVPFMQLTAQARRDIIEDLLDLQVFSIMNTLLKERVTQYKMDYHDNQMDIKMVEDRIQLTQKYLREMESDYKDTLKAKQNEIELYTTKKDNLKKEVDTLELEIESINQKVQKFTENEVKEKHTEWTSKTSVLMKDLRQAEKQLKFFDENDSCPTCQQDIDQLVKSDQQDKLNKEIDTLKADIDSVQDMLKKAKKLQNMYENMTTSLGNKLIERSKLAGSVSHVQSNIDRLQKEISDLQKKREQRDAEFDDLDDLCTRKNDLLEYKQELLDKKDLLASAGYLLKEGGIKTKIIKQYIPIMNKLIAKYLAEMEFYIQFELDEEFNETILSRYRDSFSYESFSEGEKFRIDLALLFTWRSIAKLRNSTTCNLLILDEIFDSSLDASGTDEFLKIMESLTENTNVFIISHRLDTMVDKFENLIQFKKENNFSKMVTE